MAFANPGKAGAAGAKLSQRGTSDADKAEPNQYEQAACRRDQEPAFNDVHGPTPHASLTGGKSCALASVAVYIKR